MKKIKIILSTAVVFCLLTVSCVMVAFAEENSDSQSFNKKEVTSTTNTFSIESKAETSVNSSKDNTEATESDLSAASASDVTGTLSLTGENLVSRRFDVSWKLNSFQGPITYVNLTTVFDDGFMPNPQAYNCFGNPIYNEVQHTYGTPGVRRTATVEGFYYADFIFYSACYNSISMVID